MVATLGLQVEQAYTHFAKKDADMRGELHGAITHIHSRHGDEGKEQPPVADAKAGGSGSEAEPQDEETGVTDGRLPSDAYGSAAGSGNFTCYTRPRSQTKLPVTRDKLHISPKA